MERLRRNVRVKERNLSRVFFSLKFEKKNIMKNIVIIYVEEV